MRMCRGTCSAAELVTSPSYAVVRRLSQRLPLLPKMRSLHGLFYALLAGAIHAVFRFPMFSSVSWVRRAVVVGMDGFNFIGVQAPLVPPVSLLGLLLLLRWQAKGVGLAVVQMCTMRAHPAWTVILTLNRETPDRSK